MAEVDATSMKSIRALVDDGFLNPAFNQRAFDLIKSAPPDQRQAQWDTLRALWFERHEWWRGLGPPPQHVRSQQQYVPHIFLEYTDVGKRLQRLLSAARRNGAGVSALPAAVSAGGVMASAAKHPAVIAGVIGSGIQLLLNARDLDVKMTPFKNPQSTAAKWFAAGPFPFGFNYPRIFENITGQKFPSWLRGHLKK